MNILKKGPRADAAGGDCITLQVIEYYVENSPGARVQHLDKRYAEENTGVTIDGKSIRGSKSESHKAYHVASAFAAENQLVLGELV